MLDEFLLMNHYSELIVSHRANIVGFPDKDPIWEKK